MSIARGWPMDTHWFRAWETAVESSTDRAMEALTAVALALHERKGSLTKTERRLYLWARCSLAVLFSIRADGRTDRAEPAMLQNRPIVAQDASAGGDAHPIAVRFHRGRWRAGAVVATSRGTLSLQIGGPVEGRLDVPPDRPARSVEAGEGFGTPEVPALRAVG